LAGIASPHTVISTITRAILPQQQGPVNRLAESPKGQL
jgi:hypothetical protein